jgi:heptaprenyl diphosphate synthase
LSAADGDDSVGSRAPFASLLYRLTCVLDDTLNAYPVVERDVSDFVRCGKRLRARLVFAAADGAARSSDDDLVSCAAAIELLHAASLVHDDIVDRSDERRGRSALHCTIGPRNAAVTGICLVQLGLELIGRLPRPARARFFAAGRDLARGQFAEIVRRRDVHIAPADSIAIMRQKTGSVFGLACELGGLLTDREVGECRRLRRVGAAFGMLFQIADDVDDLFASPDELGRDPGSDLREGVISLPMAIALQREGESLRPLLGMRNGSRAIARCREIVVRCGALDRSLDIAHARLREAQRHLSKLPATDGTHWISRLLEATEGRIVRHVEAARQGCPGSHAGAPSAVPAAITQAFSYAR